MKGIMEQSTLVVAKNQKGKSQFKTKASAEAA